MGSTWGRYFQVTTFGESHGPALGAVVDGLPAGVPVHREEIQACLDRRKPGTSDLVSPRKEPDQVEILSGVRENLSLGTPVALLIRNQNQRSQDYSGISRLFRPGHADFTYHQKYGLPPLPGGGRASGRETAARVAAGALAKAMLAPLGIQVRACTVEVGGLGAGRVDYDFAETDPLWFADPALADQARDMVREVRDQGDSLGGIIQVSVRGAPPGLGDPVFHKLEAQLAKAMLSIGAVKGIEFGTGFTLARMRGSQANDPLTPEGFISNNAGGTLGGISTGQEILMRLAVKPTSSIGLRQNTIDLDGREAEIQVQGRHDPCLCPRIGPVAEAMTCLVLAETMLIHQSRYGRGK